jgi:predicted RNA-binding protein YlxR (DUF448 family)/ribosomal protein L7Ae-like RNA K-turn-binding protein
LTEPRPEPQSPKPHERTCVGCGERAPATELVRLVLGPSGEIAVDAAGGGFGRGAHVHPRAACLEQAASRGLLRATKGNARSVSVAVKATSGLRDATSAPSAPRPNEAAEISTSEPSPFSAAALMQSIQDAMARRIAGLLASAVRVRHVRIGADAATSAWREGVAALVVVATDAAAARDLTAVREAVAAGAAVAWGTKQSLAAALLRRATPEGVGVVAITDTGIAAAVRDAVEKSMGAAPRTSSPQSGGAPPAGSRRAVKVTAPRGGIRSKVEPERAGRASGRHLRRAQESRQ